MGDYGLLALRLAVGTMFVVHGYAKLNGIEATAGMMSNIGLPGPVFWAWLVGVVEFVGGALLILGFYTKLAAKFLVINMVMALLLVHTKLPWSAAELPLVLLGGLLAIMGLGAGKYRVGKKDCICVEKK